MAGKNGSTWHHDWVPTNAQAVALKTHKASGGKGKAVKAAKANAPKPKKQGLSFAVPQPRPLAGSSSSRKSARAGYSKPAYRGGRLPTSTVGGTYDPYRQPWQRKAR